MSNISHPSLTLSNINKKKQIQYKQAYLISSFSSKFFQSLENNLEKEKKETPRNYCTESSKPLKSIKKVNSGNKSISQSLYSNFNTIISPGKSSSKSPLRNSKINSLSKSIKDFNNNNNKLNIPSKGNNNNNNQTIVVKKANLTKHKKSISFSQKMSINSKLQNKLKMERNNSFNNSKCSIKNKLQNITPINKNNISRQSDYSIIKNNTIEPSRPYSSRINNDLKSQNSFLKKNIRNNSKKRSSKNNITINDNNFQSKNIRNGIKSNKIMNMEILKNNLSPNNNNYSIGKNYNNHSNNIKRSLNKPIQDYLDKKNCLKNKQEKIERRTISVTEGNDFSNYNNNNYYIKEKNIIESPFSNKQNNKENSKNHRPKSKSFFVNKLLKSEKIPEIADKHELKQISSLTELKSQNTPITIAKNGYKNNSPKLKETNPNIKNHIKNNNNTNLNNINYNNQFNISSSLNTYSTKLTAPNIKNINQNNNNINNNILSPNYNNNKNNISQKSPFHRIIPPPNLKKIMKIDSCTSAGYSSPGIKKKNQDSFFIEKDFLDSREHFFLGVCDGHGIHGDLISEYISSTLPCKIESVSPSSITSAFLETNSDLITNSKIDCNLSGTTCVSLLITLTSITCANVGDSRAVLGKYEKGEYKTINLSRDQKPSENDEMKRILQFNGRIAQYYDEENKCFVGPKRIWLKNCDIPGLAMTRSFGDVIAHSVGVICEPEIGIYNFEGGEKFVIVASDGVWEFIDSEESVHIVKQFYENGMDASGAVNALVQEAYNRWKREEDIIDDITALVVFFD